MKKNPNWYFKLEFGTGSKDQYYLTIYYVRKEISIMTKSPNWYFKLEFGTGKGGK